VIFHETIFPFISTPFSSPSHSNIPLPHIFPSVASPFDPLNSFPHFDSIEDPIPIQNPISTTDTLPVPTIPIQDSVPITTPVPNLPSPPISDSINPPDSSFPFTDSQPPAADTSIPSADIIPSPTIVPSTNLVPVANNPPLRRSQRTSKPPTYLESYKCSSTTCDQSAHFIPSIKSGSSSTTSGIKYPLSNYLNSSHLSPSYANFCSLISNITKPKSYYEAVKDPKWQEAMDVEIATSKSNNT